jgi:hypothetical protein
VSDTSSIICYEKNGEYICERDVDVMLRELKEKIIRELLERITDELEIEVTVEEYEAGKSKGKGYFKKKEKIE